MNVLEQLKAMGFEEEPLRFDTGGGDFGGFGDGSGQGGGYGDGAGGVGYGGAGDVSMDVGTATTDTTASGPSAADIAAADAIATMGANQLSGASLNEGIANALAEVVSANVSSPWGSSPGQFAKSALEGLASLGFGKMAGLNVANPSQSVDNLLASANFAQYGVPAVMSVIPGANFALNAAKTFGALAEGKASVGQTIANTAISIAASQLGVPASTAMAMANGEFGKAAANTAMGAITGVVSSITGLPSGFVSAGLSLTGAGKSISDTIAQTVNETIGTPGTGAAGQGFAFGDIGQGFASGDSGQLGFGASDLNTASLAPGIDSSSASMPYSSGALNTLGALGALGVLSPRQETESSKRYQTAQVPAESPFGLMYGMRG